MRPPYANTLTVILAVVAAVGCVARFDYNIILALGWLYLGALNPRLTLSIGFYVMVFGSILVDVISMVVSSGKGAAFTLILIPIFEIMIKAGIVAICAYGYFKGKDDPNRYSDMQKQRSIQNQ